MNNLSIKQEIERRGRLFNAITYVDIAVGVTAGQLRELGIYSGAAGVWVNTELTRGIVSDNSGVAVSIMHTGKDYSDDFSEQGIHYDFPSTQRNGSHDKNEIQALKNCYEAKIPLFVISKSANKKLRDVHIGLIENFDSQYKKAYIKFVSLNVFNVNEPQLVRDTQAKYINKFDALVNKSQVTTSAKRQKRILAADHKPKKVLRYIEDYARNPDVVAEALYKANGICEACHQPAPFIKKSNGEPYLEVHHIIPLSEGGEDSLENVQAICPNCHRKMHFG
ncbi:HNH endonuclease [Photobacterium andalusiense]|uniref:HNH endonuclease n=1 Tax=Photobacterium andalusiense TaxID=2204296 RepID=A0A1Y6MA27_9GAMM|nr:HNH endonuclease signature motif containing protein [Photobacterium andalusiense]SMY33443.1 HNH endonuclease [Photobacterium andalusiense]